MSEKPKVTQRAIARPTEFEFRDVNGKRSFEGYTAMFDVPSEPLPFTESLAPKSFTRWLGRVNDQTFVVDHDDTKLLGSRRAGTVTFHEDSKGLLVRAPDLPDTSYARDLVQLHDRGEVRSMSFSFTVPERSGESWSEDLSERRLTQIRLHHATVLTGLQPAYPQTTAFVRSLALRMDADFDALAEAIEALRSGATLDDAAVALLLAAVDAQRETPAELPTPDRKYELPESNDDLLARLGLAPDRQPEAPAA